MQRCAPGKIEGTSVLCTYKIQGDQHMICMEKTNIQVTREQKLGAMGHRALLEYSPQFILNETQPVFLFDVV